MKRGKNAIRQLANDNKDHNQNLISTKDLIVFFHENTKIVIYFLQIQMMIDVHKKPGLNWIPVLQLITTSVCSYEI